jgi:hypothetical protein
MAEPRAQVGRWYRVRDEDWREVVEVDEHHATLIKRGRGGRSRRSLWPHADLAKLPSADRRPSDGS